MIVTGNKLDSETVIQNSDALSVHLHSVNDIVKFTSNINKPIIVSDDGAKKYPGKEIDNWGFPSEDYLISLKSSREKGYNYEHLCIPASKTGWKGGNITLPRHLNHREHDGLDELKVGEEKVAKGSRLSPGGKLGISGRRFTWNNKIVWLSGFSYYGYICDTSMQVVGNPHSFLTLINHVGFNMIRVFLFDNFATLQWLRPKNGRNKIRENRYPFKVNENGLLDYSIDELFFNRLREFCKFAWSLGIVVHISIFDRFFLQKNGNRAFSKWQWNSSPWNPSNHTSESQKRVFSEIPRLNKPKYPDFCRLNGPIFEIQKDVVKYTLDYTKDLGNIMLEIMNEPLNVFPRYESWHREFYELIKSNSFPNVGPPVDSAPDEPEPDKPQKPEGRSFEEEIDRIKRHASAINRIIKRNNWI